MSLFAAARLVRLALALSLPAWSLAEEASDSCRATAPCSASTSSVEEETSLLQVRVETENRGRGSGIGGDGVPELNEPDIPEAPFAWALYQRLGSNSTDPAQLSNVSAMEAPGAPMATAMKEAWQKEGLKFYQPPEATQGADMPAWVERCLGKDYKSNNLSSWELVGVVTPQIVPFVVPKDQPGRKDISIVVAPGGGGDGLAWEAEGTDVAKHFNLLGISAFVLKYRVPVSKYGHIPEISDAQRAMSLVRHRAAGLGLNASRVGLWGASHGGFVSLWTTFTPYRLYSRIDAADDWSWKPDFVILLYTAILPIFTVRANYPEPIWDPSQLMAKYAGLKLGPLSEAPPMWIGNGGQDKCGMADLAFPFLKVLRQATSVPVDFNIFGDSRHAWAMCFRMGGLEAMNHEACMWMDRVSQFISAVVEKKALAGAEALYRVTSQFERSSPPSRIN